MFWGVNFLRWLVSLTPSKTLKVRPCWQPEVSIGGSQIRLSIRITLSICAPLQVNGSWMFSGTVLWAVTGNLWWVFTCPLSSLHSKTVVLCLWLLSCLSHPLATDLSDLWTPHLPPCFCLCGNKWLEWMQFEIVIVWGLRLVHKGGKTQFQKKAGGFHLSCWPASFRGRDTKYSSHYLLFTFIVFQTPYFNVFLVFSNEVLSMFSFEESSKIGEETEAKCLH